MNAFTGDHSTVLINLDNVEFALTPGHVGEGVSVTIFFRSGIKHTLHDGNARMFIEAWHDASKTPRN